jgi:hypothetical protein
MQCRKGNQDEKNSSKLSNLRQRKMNRAAQTIQSFGTKEGNDKAEGNVEANPMV